MKQSGRFTRVLSILVLLAFLLVPAALLAIRQSQVLRLVGSASRSAAGGDFQAALSELIEAASLAYEPSRYWVSIADYAQKAGDTHTAIQYLEMAENEGLLGPDEWETLGNAYYAVSDELNAEEAWRNSIAAGGPAADLHRALFDLHINRGDYTAAAIDLEALIEIDPADQGSQVELALILAALDPDRAIEALDGLDDQGVQANTSFRELGLAMRRARALSSAPEYISLEAGRALAAQGEWEMARLAFERAVELNPDFAEAWAYLGESQERLGDSGDGSFERAYALDPDALAVNLLFALHLQRTGEPDQAVVHLESALAADPENPLLVAEMGSLLASAGDINGAIELFNQAIRSAPQDPVYWKLLANFSIAQEVQIGEFGLPAARTATLLAPQDAEAFDLLGQAYLALSNPRMAERFLTRAHLLDPDYAPAVFHLGLLHLIIGSNQQARQYLEQTVTLAPDSPLGEQARELMQDFLE